ncbi:CoA pyrophosphatase [Idiomarina xiamenensis]|uniref:NUDIX family NTP pyrophosphohydrolase n=1 Tax=Idiomarina xiamenensis 10-D-4 TaxID=740709 RepID=K2JLC3_9GAMM|nr:CoA pyrophosphatase [Idiomarina xiamenensis]EKE84266.1 NUDIX family NTP pyrophosphohydrolase [Idiomarina xiamenensis 10-D-4]
MSPRQPQLTREQFVQRFSLHRQHQALRPSHSRLKLSAVLIPVVERADGLSLILTQRANQLRHHAGQISFPGGRYEDGDQHLLNTALRETEEEIGLPREQVEVLGQLRDYPTRFNFLIRPFVALVTPQQPLRAQAGEVAEIFEVPLAAVLHQDNHYAYRIPLYIYDRVYFIPWQQRNIWGATAGILRELADHVQPEQRLNFRPLN